MNWTPPSDFRYDHDLEQELTQLTERPGWPSLDRPEVFDGEHLVTLRRCSRAYLPDDGGVFLYVRFRHLLPAHRGTKLDVGACEGTLKLACIRWALGLELDRGLREIELEPTREVLLAETETVDGLGSVVRKLRIPDADDLIHSGTQALRGLQRGGSL